MSFGWSGSDVVLLAQLAWSIVQNSRKACGEYDELTRETLRLHAVLQRLKQEMNKSDSPINRPDDTSREQLVHIARDCGHVLEQLDRMVAAYSALTEEKRSARKIWQKVRFSNGQMADLGDLRSKVVLYTSEMLFYVNLVSMGTVGRIEQQMTRDRGVLRDIKVAVEKKTAHSVLSGVNAEGSILTRYTDDDTGFWRALRRELVKEGLPSAAIHKHRHLIKAYVEELGTRGVLDEGSSEENDEQHESSTDAHVLVDTYELSDNPNSELDPSEQDIDELQDQNIDLQATDDNQDHLINSMARKRTRVKIKSQPQCTEAKQTVSEGNRDRPGIRSDSTSGRERPNKALQSTCRLRDTGNSNPDFNMEKGLCIPPNLTKRSRRSRQHWKTITIEEPVTHVHAEKVQCIICLSDDVPISKAILLSCKHHWCNSCLRRIFNLSTLDRQHMPPKCCTKDCIDLKHVEKLFDNRFKRLWNRKCQEYTTKIPIYCPLRDCGSWIKPLARGDTPNKDGWEGRCQRCKTLYVTKNGLVGFYD